MNVGSARARIIAVAVGSLLVSSVLSGCSGSPADPATQTGSSQAASAPATTTPDPAKTERTSPVPVPGGGSSTQTVKPAAPVPTKTAAIDDPVQPSAGVHVRVTKTEKLNVKAETPGEIAGPALAVTIVVKNETDKNVDLGSAVVTLTTKDGEYGQPTTSVPASPFTGSVGAGKSSTGVYVFLLPKTDREHFVLSFQYVAGTTLIQFFAG